MIKSKAWKIEKWWNIILKNQTPKGVIGKKIDHIKNIIKRMRVKLKLKKRGHLKKLNWRVKLKKKTKGKRNQKYEGKIKKKT